MNRKSKVIVLLAVGLMVVPGCRSDSISGPGPVTPPTGETSPE